MHTLGALALSWLLKAVLVMVSVALVTPKNRENTLPRALVVSLLVALLVHPFTGLIGWLFILPALMGLIAWTLIYAFAYDIGPVKSFAAGIVQAALGFAVDLFWYQGWRH